VDQVVSTVVSINAVALHRARLVLGWVNACKQMLHLSVYSTT